MKSAVVTDPKLIDEVLERSVSVIYPSKEALRKELLSGRKLKIYVGADATGPDLHLGHSTNFLMLERLRKLGHDVVVLFGNFTAMIGDPTGKDATRIALTEIEVEQHIKTWEDQLKPIVDLKKTEITKNADWLSTLALTDIIKLMSHFTVQQMIERDMFQKRIEEKKPVYLHEFLYPLLQGYDSVAQDVDLEIGGTDQTFNMLAGRTLQRQIHGKEKFVITTTLLENPKTGKKLMSKSEGGYIGLQDKPNDMFGKIMALPDEVIIQMFIDCTNEPLEDIRALEEKLSDGMNPKQAKMLLGAEIVRMYHGQEMAEKALDDFEKAFSKKEIPDEIQEVEKNEGELLSDLFLREKVVSSKSEFTRLIKEGAIHNLETEEKIQDIKMKAVAGIYKIGKHRFIKIL